MDRARSHSTETLHHPYPSASHAAPASVADVNQLGIRILGLRSIPLEKDRRFTALLACAEEMKRMPRQVLPLLAGELAEACATLPSRQALRALEAVAAVQEAPPRRRQAS